MAAQNDLSENIRYSRRRQVNSANLTPVSDLTKVGKRKRLREVQLRHIHWWGYCDSHLTTHLFAFNIGVNGTYSAWSHCIDRAGQRESFSFPLASSMHSSYWESEVRKQQELGSKQQQRRHCGRLFGNGNNFFYLTPLHLSHEAVTRQSTSCFKPRATKSQILRGRSSEAATAPKLQS